MSYWSRLDERARDADASAWARAQGSEPVTIGTARDGVPAVGAWPGEGEGDGPRCDDCGRALCVQSIPGDPPLLCGSCRDRRPAVQAKPPIQQELWPR